MVQADKHQKPRHERLRAGLTGLCVGLGLTLGSCNSAESGASNNKSGVVRLGDTVVVTVNDSAIYSSDVSAAAIEKGYIEPGEILRPDHEQYKAILSELVDQRLLSQAAIAQNLHKRSYAQRRIETAQERILGNIIVEEHLAKTVTDDAARRLYDAQLALRETSQEARASHILVETKAQAEAVKKRLENGEDFAQLAFEVSTDRGTSAEGGDLGYFQANAMVEPFSKAVFALEIDEISMPFESQFGWHVAKLVDLREAPKPSFEDMREQMINFLTYDEIKKLLETLYADAEIDYVQTGDPLSSSREDATTESEGERVDEDETSDQ